MNLLCTYLQIIQILSDKVSSSGVASGYKVFIFLIALLDNMTSFSAFLKFLLDNENIIYIYYVKIISCKYSIIEC